MHVHVCGVWSQPQESIKMTISSGSQCPGSGRKAGDDPLALGLGVVGLGRQSWALVIVAASHKPLSPFWSSWCPGSPLLPSWIKRF